MLLLAAVVVGAMYSPAKACTDPRSYAYDPERPFSEGYFQGAETIFRGRPIEYRGADWQPPTGRPIGPEIRFEVLETYLGNERAEWTAFWINTMDVDPHSLQAFREEVGEDLVVILDGPNEGTRLFTQLAMIRFSFLCNPAAMGRFSVMEPILRQKGFID